MSPQWVASQVLKRGGVRKVSIRPMMTVEQCVDVYFNDGPGCYQVNCRDYPHACDVAAAFMDGMLIQLIAEGAWTP